MAKRVDTSKNYQATPRTSKFDRLNRPSTSNKKGGTFRNVMRFLGKALLYIWISTLVAIVLLKFIPVYFTPTMAARKIDALQIGRAHV